MVSKLKGNLTKEVAAIGELARLLNYHVNNPDAYHESIEEISERLGYSVAKLDCAIWDIADAINALKYGSRCESEVEEEYAKFKSQK
jgi:hypothetical protein